MQISDWPRYCNPESLDIEEKLGSNGSTNANVWDVNKFRFVGIKPHKRAFLCVVMFVSFRYDDTTVCCFVGLSTCARWNLRACYALRLQSDVLFVAVKDVFKGLEIFPSNGNRTHPTAGMESPASRCARD